MIINVQYVVIPIDLERGDKLHDIVPNTAFEDLPGGLEMSYLGQST